MEEIIELILFLILNLLSPSLNLKIGDLLPDKLYLKRGKINPSKQRNGRNPINNKNT